MMPLRRWGWLLASKRFQSVAELGMAAVVSKNPLFATCELPHELPMMAQLALLVGRHRVSHIRAHATARSEVGGRVTSSMFMIRSH
jgi:hypothetical protein